MNRLLYICVISKYVFQILNYLFSSFPDNFYEWRLWFFFCSRRFLCILQKVFKKSYVIIGGYKIQQGPKREGEREWEWMCKDKVIHLQGLVFLPPLLWQSFLFILLTSVFSLKSIIFYLNSLFPMHEITLTGL